jgi:hypothetical protein
MKSRRVASTHRRIRRLRRPTPSHLRHHSCRHRRHSCRHRRHRLRRRHHRHHRLRRRHHRHHRLRRRHHRHHRHRLRRRRPRRYNSTRRACERLSACNNAAIGPRAVLLHASSELELPEPARVLDCRTCRKRPRWSLRVVRSSRPGDASGLPLSPRLPKGLYHLSSPQSPLHRFVSLTQRRTRAAYRPTVACLAAHKRRAGDVVHCGPELFHLVCRNKHVAIVPIAEFGRVRDFTASPCYDRVAYQGR